MVGYSKQYLKIYLWKTLSILLGFVSLFVIIPYLATDKTLYGIYSVCTSLTIFFSYADLGFLSSGIKYAAEYYITGDYKNEVKVIGFTAFFMTVVFIVINLIILFLAIKPQIIIPELTINSEQYFIARKLILLLAVSCPLVICQRVLQIIYMVRVEEYKFQQFSIFGSILRIISVFFFFGEGTYNIVGYYAFYQLVNLIVIIGAFYGIKQYGYKIKDFILAFKFDKIVFNQEKALSLSSFVFMLSMILYNELDQIVISNIYGVSIVSIYAIAFSIMTYMRTYCGLVYSPFISRFNHFTGLGDYIGLVNFTKKIIIVFAPILIIPLLNVALYSNAFVVSWVGEEYVSSSILISWMVLSYVANFITTPLTSYMTAMEKNWKIVIGAILLPLVYWMGIFIISKYIGHKSFAVMKFLGPALLVYYYWKVIMNDIKKSNIEFLKFKDVFMSVAPYVIISVVLSYFIKPVLSYSHNIQSLIFNMLIIGLVIVFLLAFALIFNKDLRNIIVNNWKFNFVRK